MRTFNGFDELLDAHDELPDFGFLHTLAEDDVDSPDDLAVATFLMWESQEEELFLESSEEHRPWLEAPTFVDIIEAYREHHPTATPGDLTRTVLHYWEHDDFLD